MEDILFSLVSPTLYLSLIQINLTENKTKQKKQATSETFTSDEYAAIGNN